MDAGIVLIPKQTLSEKIITLEDRIRDTFGFVNQFGLTAPVPHITLWQGSLMDNAEYKKAVRRVAKQARDTLPGLSVYMDDITYVPDGWYFWRCQLSKELYDLHKFAIRQIRPLIPDEDRHAGRNASKSESETIRRFGYKYAGDSYLPHITIGRTESGEDPKIIEAVGAELTPQNAEVEKIAVYTIGEDGVCQDLLAETYLKKDTQ